MEKWRAFRNSPRYEDAKGGVVKKGKNLLMTILQIILIVGISYVILSPDTMTFLPLSAIACS